MTTGISLFHADLQALQLGRYLEVIRK
jgi:hypothetical protein